MKTCDTETLLANDTERSRQPACGFRLSGKIQARHLERQAVVYVRQSSGGQVQENIESTQLQYALVDRAKALGGWPERQVVVIDDDLGVSGQSVEGRVGFQRLLAEISLGHVGMVLGIEMSRLARSCRDWHHLLELCAVFGSLLGDADGVYEPRDDNDRLLLGLKGTMSEAELHILRGRLDAGKRSGCRGQYYTQAPIGYMRTDEGLVLEPDEQARRRSTAGVRQVRRTEKRQCHPAVFSTGENRLGIIAVQGPDRGDLTLRVPSRTTLLGILHHPIYAGAYVYGRRKTDPSRRIAGKPRSGRRWASQDEWDVLIQDALPAYITWEQWERNQAHLRENSTHYGIGAPECFSSLAGRVVCGRCGARMGISYAAKNKARFTCDAARCQWGESQCQSLRARPLEIMVVEQVLRALKPASLELSLQAAEHIEAEQQRIEAHHRKTVVTRRSLSRGGSSAI